MKRILYSVLLSLVMLMPVYVPVYANQTITVAAFPAIDEIIKEALVEWRKKHPGVEVKIVSRQYTDHHTAMTAALATKSGLPDLMAIEYSYLGRFVKSGGLTDLNQAPFNAKQFKHRFVNFSWQQANDRDKGQGALPTDIGPGTLYYRQDILQQAGLMEADLTQSWDSYIESGKTIKQKTGAYLLSHARDLKDIIISTDIPAGHGIYFDDQGKSVVGKAERFKQAFRLAKTVRDNQLDARVNAWTNEWSESFRRASVATQMMGAWLGGHLSNWLAPETKGKWRSANLPNGVFASWGGTFYAIPAKAEHKQLAWSLIQYLTLDKPQQLKAFVRQDAFPALLEAHDSDFFAEPIEFLGDQKARLQWRRAALNIEATAVFKHDPIAQEIVNAELDRVLTRDKNIDEALNDADRMISRRARR